MKVVAMKGYLLSKPKEANETGEETKKKASCLFFFLWAISPRLRFPFFPVFQFRIQYLSSNVQFTMSQHLLKSLGTRHNVSLNPQGYVTTSPPSWLTILLQQLTILSNNVTTSPQILRDTSQHLLHLDWPRLDVVSCLFNFLDVRKICLLVLEPDGRVSSASLDWSKPRR